MYFSNCFWVYWCGPRHQQ